ncbi:hypothetical protein HYZ97_00295 [Candidatus Pacearchaeota archaeon]|nr:hypothetical protein [Candidatus Pacearchaeota archaeon]
MHEVVFASNNQAKLKRMQMLISSAGAPFVLLTPQDIGIQKFDVEEDGKTLRENAMKKARILSALTPLPILTDDSGFFIAGAEIDPVMVKRNALQEISEKSLSVKEIAEKMLQYYQNLASSYGGKVDAEWRTCLYLLTPVPERNGFYEEAVRPCFLTNTPKGTMDPYFPLRPLYISKTTGKYVLEQNEQEEQVELRPITEALVRLFRMWKDF